MQDLSKLAARTLLVEWASYCGNAPLQHLSRFLIQMGYVKQTKRHPGGRPITSADVRRALSGFLKDHPLYPSGRPPNESDYQRIKQDILADHFQEEQV